ncbi:anthranilate phosphoribosyltransferase [Staphylococcus agnetis]|uniref:anthranilate phosphoribosyltransferase n=1 Tax=Staphylococcus agnetis TaxID=985762 RepID=UPI002418AB89|nr:anthranilate phosphoribosyltransferase [Staphylococcus agnetis]MDG4943494.1 anthranilate phosphoribosyltransferase [Staphylococcus agnetis]
MRLLDTLRQNQSLSEQDIHTFVQTLLSEDVLLHDKVTLLKAYTKKGETADELYHLTAKLIQTTYHPQPEYSGSMCVCGTGGDGSNSFNISTTVSFIVAAAGVSVVKHGNKSVTSQSGSVDVLQALGISTTPVNNVPKQLTETNLAFVSAITAYPIMKQLQPVRKSIQHPTIFNIVGPMINPFKLDYQVMGIYDPHRIAITAETLLRLGRKKAIVIHGAGGMDETTLSGDNLIYEVNEGQVTSYTLNATELGLRSADNSELRGGTPEENKALMLSILKGANTSVCRDVVILNAAIALYVAEKAINFQDGVIQAAQLIQSGQAYRQYLKMVKESEHESVG